MFKTVMGSGLILADAAVSFASVSTSMSGALMYALCIANAAAALVVINGWSHQLFEGRFGEDQPAQS